MTTIETTTTRRAVLAGSAALPALAMPAAAETHDPAVAAFRAFLPPFHRWTEATLRRADMTDWRRVPLITLAGAAHAPALAVLRAQQGLPGGHVELPAFLLLPDDCGQLPGRVCAP